MTRREAREQALCLIFERMFNEESLKEIIALAHEARDLEPDPFAMQLAQGVCENIGELDEKIEKYSIGWSMARLSKVILSILRLSLYEIDHIESIPVSVTINEAVELAKKYGGDGDSAFINGILGTVARNGEEKPQNDNPAKVE
jgi:N utilization substance protein B